MKKILSLILTSFLAISLSACGNSASIKSSTSSHEESDNEQAKTITIKDFNGEIEVPYNPQKIAVLDLAALDIIDALELGDRVVGVPKKSSVTYLTSYNENEDIANLGSVKEVDMETLNSTQPDLIIIGGRLSSEFENLSKIAPTILIKVDHSKGYLESFDENVRNIAKIFGVEEKAEDILSGFSSRVAKINEAATGKTAIVSVVTSSSLSTLGNDSRGSLICNEAGFENVATDIDSTHGDSASFELLLDKNPDYIFVIDRDYARNVEGSKAAKEVMENEIVMKTDAYKNGNIVYLTPDVWYLAEGGVYATDIMISDLEGAVLK